MVAAVAFVIDRHVLSFHGKEEWFEVEAKKKILNSLAISEPFDKLLVPRYTDDGVSTTN